MNRSLALLLMSCLCVAIPNQGWAQKQPVPSEEKDPAKLFDEALAYYNLGNYKQALVLLEKSYLLSKQPDLLYNMGLCQRKLEKNEEALTLFRSFLREAPQSPLRADVETKISELQALLEGKVTIEITSNPSGADVRKGGASSPILGKTPFTTSLDAGAYYFTLTLDGYEPHSFDLETKPSKSYVIPEIRLLPKTTTTITPTTTEETPTATSQPNTTPTITQQVAAPDITNFHRFGVSLLITNTSFASSDTRNTSGGFMLELLGKKSWKGMHLSTQFLVAGGSPNTQALLFGPYWQKKFLQKWLYEFSISTGPFLSNNPIGNKDLALAVSLSPVRLMYRRTKSSKNLLSLGFSVIASGPLGVVVSALGYQRAF